MGRRPVNLRRTLAASCLVTLCAVAACAKTRPARGGLMLIVSSDGPRTTLGRLDIEVDDENDKTLLLNSYRVPQETTLPTTIAIVSNGSPTAEVKLTVIGWKDSEGKIPLDRRDAIVTQIPNDRVASLAVVLSTLCADKVTVDENGKARSTCRAGETCNGAGVCTDTITVSATRLPSYQSGDENDAGVVDTATTGGRAGTAIGGEQGENANEGGSAGEGSGAAGGVSSAGNNGNAGACRNDDDCSGATPACEPGGQCGQCSPANTSQCGSSFPVCLKQSCVECSPETKRCQPGDVPQSCSTAGSWLPGAELRHRRADVQRRCLRLYSHQLRRQMRRYR